MKNLSKSISCSVSECEAPIYCLGFCPKHYARNRLHGSPTGGRTYEGEPAAFVEKAIKYQRDDCLIWPFGKTQHGYGAIVKDGRVVPVHRNVCEAAHGSPPSTKHQVAHRCGVRSCVNPEHLRWATAKENHADKVIHETSNRGERQWNAKLTAKQVLEIRELRWVLPAREIGRQFGIGSDSVYLIWKRKRWAWLG